MLTKPPLAARETERRAQELFDEVLKSYFTGQPHQSPLGDVTFPLCDLFYNQADITAPAGRPQIHLVFTSLRPQEWWFASGKTSPLLEVLARVASGVQYNQTTDGHVEEVVNGALMRRLEGQNIRWRVSGDDLLEEVQDAGGAWSLVRLIPNATELVWSRSANSYIESTDQAVMLRTLAFGGGWSGPAKLVVVDSLITVYIRTPFRGGDQQAADFLARKVADNFKEMLEGESRGDLAEKGVRHCRIQSGPVPLASTSHATRMLVFMCKWRYNVPRTVG